MAPSQLDEPQGGTFTISNGGVYGSLMSTPILNMPQSGILGMHKIPGPAHGGERPDRHPPDDVPSPSPTITASSTDRARDLPRQGQERIEDPQRLLLDVAGWRSYPLRGKRI